MTVPAAPQRPLLARIFISSGEPRLRAAWRLAGQMLIMGACLVFFGLPAAPLLLLDPSIEYILLVSQVASLLGVTASVYLARRFLDRRTFTSLGLRLREKALPDLVAGFAIAGVMLGLVYLTMWGLGWLTFEGFAWQFQPFVQAAGGVLLMLAFFIAVGWVEELLFRGYWLQNLEEGMNLFWAILLSSISFSIAHLFNPSFSWAALAGIFAAGIFLAIGYLRTRQLWLPIGLHIGWNFFESTVFGFEVSGLSGLPRLLHHSVQGPELLTGGGFGPEAGLMMLPALLVGTALIYRYTRQRKPPFPAGSVSSTATSPLD